MNNNNVIRRLEALEAVSLDAFKGSSTLNRDSWTTGSECTLSKSFQSRGLPGNQINMQITLTILPFDPNVSLCLIKDDKKDGTVPFQYFEAQLWILNKANVVLHKTVVRSRRSPNNKANGFCTYNWCPCQNAPFHVTHPSICPSSIIWNEFENVPAGQSLSGCIKLKLKLRFDLDSSTTEAPFFNQGRQTTAPLSSHLIDKEETFDFTIRAGKDLKSEFKAHKCVLAARSSFFAAMFKSGMKESSENLMECSAVDPNLMDIFIKFLYDVDILKFVEDADFTVELLKIADMYQVPDLTQFCTQQLLQLQEYTVKNACKIFSAIQTVLNSDLEFRVLAQLKKAVQSGTLEKDSDFQRFVMEQPTMAIRLFTKMVSRI